MPEYESKVASDLVKSRQNDLGRFQHVIFVIVNAPPFTNINIFLQQRNDMG